MLKTTRNSNGSKSPASAAKRDWKGNKWGYYLAIGWTLTLALVIILNWFQAKEHTEAEALIALRMTVEKDQAFRSWATHHGGVYVPITPENQPNPYLSPALNRDVKTSAGQNLTLLNPAYIMRQVYEIELEDFGVYNRLVSLKPINPINAADSWEAEALKQMEAGEIEEFHGIVDFNEQPSLRLIRPFYIEEGCLKCHSHQGYQIDDLRGAISASTPMAPYNAIIGASQLAVLRGYGLVWLLGMIGIGWFMRRLNTSIANLGRKEARNRTLVTAIPDMLFRYNRDGVCLDIETKNDSVLSQLITSQFGEQGLIGQNINMAAPLEIAEKFTVALTEVTATGEMQIIEYSYQVGDKEYHFEERMVLEEDDTIMSIIRDVTSQKNSESKLEYLSYHDNLTGLHNRHYLEDELKEMAASGKFPISIIMSDLNGLKMINDTLGHAMGDKLLVNSANVLKQSLRDYDVLARAGGDEFVAVLPATSEKIGQEIIGRIRANILQHNNLHPELPISLALGLATAQDSSQDLMDTYKEADDNMYSDKMTKGR